GKGIDEAVAVIGGVKADLPPDIRHAEGIAIAADAGDGAGNQAAGSGMVRAAGAERVHRRDRPRAHGKDIAENPPDPGRRALIGLYVAGVIVALHLEDQRLPIADIDNAGILAGAADDLLAGG